MDPSGPFRLTPAVHRELLAHARDEAPRECCGLLAGPGRQALRLHRLANSDSGAEAETHYSADPANLIATVRAIRESGSEIVAIYHSHPRWPAVPSRTDLRENFWGETPRPIVSLLTDPPTLRVWVLGPDDYRELPWELLETAPVDASATAPV